MFLVTALACSLQNIFDANQQSVFIMLPADRKGYGSTGEYYPLELMVIVMFLLQLIRVGKLIHRQCTTDVFLIDWEKVMIVPVGTLLGRLRLVGWLISLLVGWLISWLVGWLV